MEWHIIIFQAKSQFKRRSTANNVEIIIPVPEDADSPKFKTTTGSCKYAPEQNAIIWTIKSFPVSPLKFLVNYRTYKPFLINLYTALSPIVPPPYFFNQEICHNMFKIDTFLI